jgi:hypothetical protein
MIYVHQIMQMFSLDQAAAFRIYDNMTVDFSECTSAEFKRAALSAKMKLGL